MKGISHQQSCMIKYHNYQYHLNHINKYFVKYIKKGPKTFGELRFMQMKRKEMIKVCGNKKCSKSKRIDNKVQFKICKRCKVFYFCSRKCQKIAWKVDHRKMCYKITQQLLL